MTRNHLQRLSSVVVLVALMAGCTVALEQPRPSMVGQFSGLSPADEPIVFTLAESATGLIGHGTFAGQPISISLLTALRAVGVATVSGSTSPIVIELTPDGESISFVRLGDSIALTRGAQSQVVGGGPFSGAYAIEDALALAGTLELVQVDDLVAGTGQVLGRIFALSGAVDGGGVLQARGRLGDGDETILRGRLSDGGRTLIMDGFGAALTFTRR